MEERVAGVEDVVVGLAEQDMACKFSIGIPAFEKKQKKKQLTFVKYVSVTTSLGKYPS